MKPLELLSPLLRVYDPRIDASTRRCFHILHLEHWGDMTEPHAPIIDAGVIIEAYVKDGFMVSGLVPPLAARIEIASKRSKTQESAVVPWATHVSQLLAHARSERSHAFPGLTTLERFQKLHTYTALRVARCRSIDHRALAEFGYRQKMTLNDIRLGTLRLFIERCIELDTPQRSTASRPSESRSGVENGVRTSHADGIHQETPLS